jgi:hypothetical protein
MVGLCWLSLFERNFLEIARPFTLKNHAVLCLSTLSIKGAVNSKATGTFKVYCIKFDPIVD